MDKCHDVLCDTCMHHVTCARFRRKVSVDKPCENDSGDVSRIAPLYTSSGDASIIQEEKGIKEGIDMYAN